MDTRRAELIVEHLGQNYRRMYHAPVGAFRLPYLVPGAGYEHCLWDWDTRFAAEAVFAVMDLVGAGADVRESMVDAMRGSLLNLLSFQQPNGAVPHCVYLGAEHFFAESVEKYDEPNQAKPVLAQLAELIVRRAGDDGWIRPRLGDLDRFLAHYDERYRHEPTGLYLWRSGAVIGVDNDPCTFGRPLLSSASVFLNCLFVREFEALASLHERAGDSARAAACRARRDALVEAIRRHLWDRRDRFFYSADVQCQTDRRIPYLNSGLGVFWPCIPLRIRLWTGFLPMWAGAATPEQAADLVRLHLGDREALACDYGIRSLAANEPMYDCRATSNPSNWLGPVWGIANYLVFRGLLDYGFRAEAERLAEQTVTLFGRDIERHGGMHEYYVPETGEGVMNLGFMNWNYLVANMLRDLGAAGHAGGQGERREGGNARHSSA